MHFLIENIEIIIHQDLGGFRLITNSDHYFFTNQSIAEAKEIIQNNFTIVKEYYFSKCHDQINSVDLNELCLQIVLYYFYLQNNWKSTIEKYKDLSLNFDEKYFSHPYTYDKILNFFKNKDSKNYITKSAFLIGKSNEEIKKWESEQNEFYNSFR